MLHRHRAISWYAFKVACLNSGGVADVSSNVSKFCEFFLIFRQILCVFLFVLVVVPYQMPALTSEKLEKILDEKLRPISDLSEQLKHWC